MIFPNWLGSAQEGGSIIPGGPCVVPPLLQSCNRAYTTRRVAIAEALTEKLKGINGISPFIVDVEGRVFSSPKFVDDIEAFPEIHIHTGYETRLYQGAGFKDRFLPINIKCYVRDEDNSKELGILLEDVETLLEDNAKLAYYDRDNTMHFTYNISVLSIVTYEINTPLLLGEITCEVRY